jgi:acetate kinase
MSHVIVVNAGSSSIKFAAYEASNEPRQILRGEVQRVGQPGTGISAEGLGEDVKDQPITGGDHTEATGQFIDWLRGRLGDRAVAGIGHRVVHGGFHLAQHQIITEATLSQLRQAAELDPAHLPREIALIESFRKAFAGIPQVACFDTAFFKDLPILSKLLPIPRKYFDAGVHRFGFHGLSYTFLTQQLRRMGGDAAVNGRVILAHLGSGASMAAIREGQPIDTTMAFTPTAGLVMGTRCGDLDPGLLVYLLRNQKLSADQLEELLNKQSGLLGVSGSSADLRDLLDRRATDIQAGQAVDLFCYQAKKWIGSFAAALGGLDTLVFSGGIGEHSAEARAGICAGLEFLGIWLDTESNVKGLSKISSGPVGVHVIPTDEEIVIANTVFELTGGSRIPG